MKLKTCAWGIRQVGDIGRYRSLSSSFPVINSLLGQCQDFLSAAVFNFSVQEDHCEDWLRMQIPGLYPEILLQEVWGRASECTLLTSDLVNFMQVGPEPHFKKCRLKSDSRDSCSCHTL